MMFLRLLVGIAFGISLFAQGQLSQIQGTDSSSTAVPGASVKSLMRLPIAARGAGRGPQGRWQDRGEVYVLNNERPAYRGRSVQAGSLPGSAAAALFARALATGGAASALSRIVGSGHLPRPRNTARGTPFTIAMEKESLVKFLRIVFTGIVCAASLFAADLTGTWTGVDCRRLLT